MGCVVSLCFQASPIAGTSYLCHLGDSWPLSLHYCVGAAVVQWDVKHHSIVGSEPQTQDIDESLPLLLTDAAEGLYEEFGGLGLLAVNSPS